MSEPTPSQSPIEALLHLVNSAKDILKEYDSEGASAVTRSKGRAWCEQHARFFDEAPEEAELFPGKYPKGLPKMHKGEPWFLLRAKDELSTNAVAFYRDLLSNLNMDAGAQSVGAFLQTMAEWQEQNPDLVGLPD